MKLSRRGILKAGAASSVLAASGMPVVASSKRGGRLRLGLSGANKSDSWDGRTYVGGFMQVAAQGCVFDTLTEIAADGTLVGELAESWEVSADAKLWTFNLRKGVTFHNGKKFGADDAIESLFLHIGKGAQSVVKPILSTVTEIKKITDSQIQIVLDSGNADFPFLLSDYHLLMYPAGQIEAAIAEGIGTGLYRVAYFEPGVRFVGTRIHDHYKGESAGFFDSVEILAINDTTARMNALVSGHVDAVNQVDFKAIDLLNASPRVEVFEVTGNHHFSFSMLSTVAPFNDLNVRRALKYAVNRQEMVDKILLGHGAVANDHSIGPANQYYAENLPQTEYDLDRSAFYLKKAGLKSLDVDLSVSDVAFVGASEAGLLCQANATSIGININIIKEPAEDYWSNVWMKKPWGAGYCSGRATEDWMFSVGYETGAPWNDILWENARFQELLKTARAELSTNKRCDMYVEMQKLMSEDGGSVIPIYANYVGANGANLRHSKEIGNVYQMDSGRIAERWWFAS